MSYGARIDIKRSVGKRKNRRKKEKGAGVGRGRHQVSRPIFGFDETYLTEEWNGSPGGQRPILLLPLYRRRLRELVGSVEFE